MRNVTLKPFSVYGDDADDVVQWSIELNESLVSVINATIKLVYPNYTVLNFAEADTTEPAAPNQHDCYVATTTATIWEQSCVKYSILHYTGSVWEVLTYRYDQLNYLLSGTGDMSKAVYDPTNILGDAFDMDNMVEGATNLILTVAERAAIADAATQAWVGAQNYLDASDITDMATQTWVGAQGFLTSYTETDPVFTAWNKSTGISITESQISDLQSYLTSFTETDPVFTAWNKSTGISITESQISDLQSYLTSYTETDPVFTAWNKSTGISITESQISDLQSYLTSISAQSVGSLSDVTLTGWASGKILEFDASGNLVVGVKTSGSGIALTDLSASSPLAYNNVSGDFSIASGFSIPTTTEKGYYDSAYGWGNHASAGYLVSSDLTGYATQTWVNAQNFLDSSDIADMATQTWVTAQSYFTSSDFGTTAGTVCQGNDSRLTDARTPVDASVTYSKVASDLVDHETVTNTIHFDTKARGTCTTSGATNISISGLKSGKGYLLKLVNTGGYSVAFSDSWVKLPDGLDLSVAGTYMLSVTCFEATTSSEYVVITAAKIA